MKNIEMFVVTHKDLFVKIPENYKIIGVGQYGIDNNKQILSDSTGDNISEKNPNYCELTAIYWLWKNYDLPNYIGICHYRRYFVDGITSRIFDTKKIARLMEKYDVILPKKVKVYPDVWGYFVNSISGRENDLISLEKLIKYEYNDYYDSFNKIMHSNSSSYCNMAVMTREDFKEYCSWLFELLKKYEKFVDLTGYSKQEQRIYGFMSEFLLNVWIDKKNKNVKYVNSMLYTESNLKNFLKKIYLIFNIRIRHRNRRNRRIISR